MEASPLHEVARQLRPDVHQLAISHPREQHTLRVMTTDWNLDPALYRAGATVRTRALDL